MINTILTNKADKIISRYGYEHPNTIRFCQMMEAYFVQPDPLMLGLILDEYDSIMGIQYA